MVINACLFNRIRILVVKTVMTRVAEDIYTAEEGPSLAYLPQNAFYEIRYSLSHFVQLCLYISRQAYNKSIGQVRLYVFVN